MGNVLGFVRLMRQGVRHVGTAAATPLAGTSPDAALGFQNPEIPASPASEEALSTLQAVIRDLLLHSDGKKARACGPSAKHIF